jgi:2-keto-4-pentenoate hydratase/2-oxohepta-3-ene-1,7-dioic acid hydratase in catechol pathway
MTLLPGDLLMTGTPAGVGFARQPPEYLQPGDVMEAEIDTIGLLRNTISGT